MLFLALIALSQGRWKRVPAPKSATEGMWFCHSHRDGERPAREVEVLTASPWPWLPEQQKGSSRGYRGGGAELQGNTKFTESSRSKSFMQSVNTTEQTDLPACRLSSQLPTSSCRRGELECLLLNKMALKERWSLFMLHMKRVAMLGIR